MLLIQTDAVTSSLSKKRIKIVTGKIPAIDIICGIEKLFCTKALANEYRYCVKKADIEK